MSAVPWVTGANAALLTDLYEFTMAETYFAEGIDHEATFELFVRRLPGRRNYLIAAGVDDAVDLALNFGYDSDAVAKLDALGTLSRQLLDRLAALRFTGDVWAVPEGEVVFANEPILRVTAPVIEGQLLETLVLNTVLFQTMIASKAARLTESCAGRTWSDFSARRDHGADAALKVARAAYIGGASSTSNILAAAEYGIPASGTMAHSYVLTFASEEEAFRAYARRFTTAAILLIDTYDVAEGARRAARVGAEFAERGVLLRGVRLDSGDLAGDAIRVRRILDDAGQQHMRIFASGDLDEYAIAELVAKGAPIDSFGVGTRLGTSEDAPSLSGVYKLVSDAAGPKAKYSEGKQTLPGAKHVYRHRRDGVIDHDTLALAEEPPADGEPLLRHVAGGGRRLIGRASLEEARERRRLAVESLPPALRTLETATPGYRVEPSPALEGLAAEVQERVRTVARLETVPRIDP